MVDIFKEVEEDLRSERLKNLWKKYGTLVIAFAVGLVLVTIYNVVSGNLRDQRFQSRGEQLGIGLEDLSAGEEDKAAGAFTELAAGGPPEIAAIATFNLAEALLRDGDREGALGALQSLIDDKDLPDYTRDLARVKHGWLRAETDPYAALERDLGLLTTSDSVWRHSARELLGFAAFREDNFEAARTHFQFLLLDGTTPATQRERANQMLVMTESLSGAGEAPDAGSDSGRQPGGGTLPIGPDGGAAAGDGAPGGDGLSVTEPAEPAGTVAEPTEASQGQAQEPSDADDLDDLDDDPGFGGSATD
ncbi:MAG: hypothetical protein AAGH45_00835 [Pseudomonadota bacterium]